MLILNKVYLPPNFEKIKKQARRGNNEVVGDSGAGELQQGGASF